MRSDRFSLFGVVGGGVFFTITGLAQPFFSLHADALGASTVAIGMMVTLKALLPIFIAMPAGQLIDSVGPMRVLLWGAWLLLASLLCLVLAQDLPLLALSQVLLGACVVMMASAFQVLVARGDRQARNDAIKRYSMWMSGGAMLGPLIGGAIASVFPAPVEGYRAAFAASAVATVVFMAVIALLARRYPRPEGEGLPRIRDVLRPSGMMSSYRDGIDLARLRPVQFGLTGTFLVMFIQSLYLSFLPLYLAQNGYGTMLIAIIVSIKGLAGMLARFGLGLLMRRLPLETILTAAGTVAAVCVVVTPFAVAEPLAMIATAVVLGGAVGLNLPVSIMIMVDAVAEARRGKLMGLRLLSNRFAQILSPALFGLAGGVFGLSAAFGGGGALLVGTVAGFALWSRRAWKLTTWGTGARGPGE